jgi:DNA-binding MarR family transcriptional regulator
MSYKRPNRTPSAELAEYARIKMEMRRIQAGIDARLQAAGLIPELVETLFAVMNSPGAEWASPAEVARGLGAPPATLTSRLKRLEAAGWVERRPASADRRMLLIGITNQGAEAADRAWSLYEAALEGFKAKSLLG